MAAQVIHYNVTVPERCFPITPAGNRMGNEVRYSTVRIAGGMGSVRGLSAERRMQSVACGATDCHVYGEAEP
jgi:hypothetical protein